MLTADTIEEKILERAELKLRMDAVVIQTGQSNKKLNGNDMLAAIRYGADKVFRGDGAPITDDDIDAIIDRGKEKTEAMKKVLEEKAKGDVLDFKLEYTTSLQEFDGIDYTEERKRIDNKKAVAFALAMGDAIGKRERKVINYNTSDLHRQLMNNGQTMELIGKKQTLGDLPTFRTNINSRVVRPRDYPRMKLWQFFDVIRLAELQALENEEFVTRAKAFETDDYVPPENKEERYVVVSKIEKE